ncbi:MAG TPA: molybdopterin molybdotransferase MoeA [Burkholderiaceae bacterium]|nr:molybdopterin molybdotransferase MoeA [Burkholderiaceae bacterium]
MKSLVQIAAEVSGYDPGALPVAQARQFIARLVPRVTAVEMLPLRSALGRVLARDLVSAFDVPAHDNAAMDGYALRGSDLAADAPTRLSLAGTGLAGQPYLGEVQAGQCLRITTGAVMPAGLDTVVPQEFVRIDGDAVIVPPGVVRSGDNRRFAGEDLAAGEAALQAGRVLRPADLGLLASLGSAEVPVLRRLRVAFFSTGDELRSIGEPLDAGCVYDSNRYTLWGMLQRLGVEVIDLGVVRDDPDALEAAFREAAACADAVITSGGVSVGEADHTKEIMARLGEVLFWRIAMRPGRPMAIGRIGARPGAEGRTGTNADAGPGSGRGGHAAILFGLPGNPVAVMVTFYAFVRDALLAMSGASVEPLPMLRAASATAIRKKPGRTEFQRGIVSRAADGNWQVSVAAAQGSGILRSMSTANGLVVLGDAQGNVAAGEPVDVLPFDGLI